MDNLKKLVSKYKKNKKILLICLQILLVYHRIRPGASIDGITNKNIVIDDILPLLKQLNLHYVYNTRNNHDLYSEKTKNEMIALGVNKSYFNKSISSLYISKKSIPKSFDESFEKFGKFLGYQCASNDFEDPDIIKEGRIVFTIQEVETKLMILADVCNNRSKKDFVEILKHYRLFLEKGNENLKNYGFKLSLTIKSEKTNTLVTID